MIAKDNKLMLLDFNANKLEEDKDTIQQAMPSGTFPKWTRIVSSVAGKQWYKKLQTLSYEIGDFSCLCGIIIVVLS